MAVAVYIKYCRCGVSLTQLIVSGAILVASFVCA